MSLNKVQANITTKKIFSLIKDFKEMIKNFNEKRITIEERDLSIAKMKQVAEKIENAINLCEEEMDKIVIRDFVDCQDKIIDISNELSQNNTNN